MDILYAALLSPIPRSPESEYPRFKNGYDDTRKVLAYEADRLGAEHIRIEVFTDPKNIRVTGQLKQYATITHPGVRVVLVESDRGDLAISSAASTQWRDNVRCCALALHDKRRLLRYGIGEQATYGALQLPRMSSASMGLRAEAEQLVAEYGPRKARAMAHPDSSGGSEDLAGAVAEVINRLA